MGRGRSRAVRTVELVLLVVLVLVVAGCAAGPNDQVSAAADAGFWQGLWHGLISPITFVISLFTDSVNVYEVHNNGNWYDFGFIFGVSMAFGGTVSGGAASRRRAGAGRR